MRTAARASASAQSTLNQGATELKAESFPRPISISLADSSRRPSRAAVRIDDRAASRALLRDLDQALHGEDPDHGAARHVGDLRESVEAARQLPSDPASALTEAELKVLRHLPTNLSLADIATRLFVSRNTVKSHVAAIYRKLNATSRSDAVDLARRTGLLEEGPSEDRD